MASDIVRYLILLCVCWNVRECAKIHRCQRCNAEHFKTLQDN